MSDRMHFRREQTTAAARKPEACAPWALLLVEAAEGLLSNAEQAVLDRHLAGCNSCAQELADAQRGAAWLGLLKDHVPEPPPALLANILARTSGAPGASLPIPAPAAWTPAPDTSLLPQGSLQGAWPHPGARPTFGSTSGIGGRLGRWFGVTDHDVPAFQPRLAMTSAMAFFSICLTLNLLGISVRNLRAESLRPAGLQRTVADKGASLVRSFEGIRLVYRVESRVNEWRTASNGDGAPLDVPR